MYFQDESRFGLMTALGRCITAKGVKPVINYQHKFKSTYLWGSYSPIDGDSFVWEINGTDSLIFEQYLKALSLHRPDEFKILVIDNAGFHSTKNMAIPNNIHLLRIPPYSPELNPCEQIWQYMKNRFQNQVFSSMDKLKEWLNDMVNSMSTSTVKSIVSNHHYLDAFFMSFNR